MGGCLITFGLSLRRLHLLDDGGLSQTNLTKLAPLSLAQITRFETESYVSLT